ncbi:MAG: arginine repressor [Oscillospiraceae bacterium]|jgi:transcriptional regulator of arginine metabolism|nr:arginine repressor [Oscillospiraceae bacterium]
MKSARQTKILEIIASRDIETQNQLIEALEECGFKSTQATVSRDMRELRLVKELSDGGNYRYVCPGEPEQADNAEKVRTIFRHSVKSYACAQNLVVIKTLPGLADAACVAIETLDVPGLVGTIAGDDTAFIAMSDNAHAELFCKDIRNLM